jgi:hypothetical protein
MQLFLSESVHAVTLLSLRKLQNPNQNSIPNTTRARAGGWKISRAPFNGDGLVRVRVSALHVGAGALVAEVVAAHLDDEVIVPPALAVVGVRRAAAPVSASAAAAAPVSTSAAAAAPVSASASAAAAAAAAARREGAGRGARRGGGRGEAALARWKRRRQREGWGGGISRGRDGVRAGDVGGGIRDFGGSHVVGLVLGGREGTAA